MEAIVLAGGLGTRLRAIVPDVPKPMASVAGRPFLEILLESLARKGFDRVILSIGFMAEKISSHFGNSYAGMRIEYSIEDTPLGTGGAVRLALTKAAEDHVFVFNGDTYLDLDVSAVEALWSENHLPVVVAREVNDTARYGRLSAIDGWVKEFAEKAVVGAGLINAGCYVFRANQLDEFSPGTIFSLEADYLAKRICVDPFIAYVCTGPFIDIGVPDDFKAAQTLLAEFV